MAEGGYVNVEIADRRDKAAGKCNLLLGLAQRSSGGALVTGIDLAARKRNLPGVVVEMGRALSEQHARLVAFNDWHQHSGQPDRPHRSHSGDHRGIGVLLVVPRDHVGSANPVGTSNVSLSCAREKNFDAVRAPSLCAAGINSRFSIQAFSLAR